MKTQKGLVYTNTDNEFYTPAMTGNFYIVDMWECDKNGLVKDIEENPCPKPVNTSDLKYYGQSKHGYSYPEFSVNF